MKVYSIASFDNVQDEPPRVTVFSTEERAIQSVLDEVERFASLHEMKGGYDLDEIPEALRDGNIFEFVSNDGLNYSWHMQTHELPDC